MISQAIFKAGDDVLKAYDVKWSRFDAASIKTLYESIIFEGELPDKDEFNKVLAIQYEKYLMEELRFERDKRLTDCDWTQNKDVVLSEEDMNVWKQYRQDLRDLPNNVKLGDDTDILKLFPDVPKKTVISPPVIPVKIEEDKDEEPKNVIIKKEEEEDEQI